MTIFLSIFIPIVIWFVFGYIAVRMYILHTDFQRNRYGISRFVVKNTYVFWLLIGGLFSWFGWMIGAEGKRTRRIAHFLPKVYVSRGPSERLIRRWFAVNTER